MNSLCSQQIENRLHLKVATYPSVRISVITTLFQTDQPCLHPTPFSPWSSSVGRVRLYECSPGLGSRTEIWSEAHCLVGKTGIIFLTFSYLHATMREDRMSKLFRKISLTPKNTSICSLCPHLHRLNEPGPSTVLAYVCVCVFTLFVFFKQHFVYLCVLKGPAWDKKPNATTNTTLTEREHCLQETLKIQFLSLLVVRLKRGFQLSSPSEEQPNKNLNNKNSFRQC